MENRMGICRLCLKICDSFKAIDETTKDVLNKLLLNTNLAISKGPVTCSSCGDMLIKCVDFKTTCFDTYDYIVLFISSANNAKLDLKDVYVSKTAIDVPEDHNVCSFCMGLVKQSSSVSLDNEEGLEEYLPKLDLSIVKNPTICISCHKFLKIYFRFMRDCLIVEEEVKNYCKTLSTNSKGLIELTDVLQYTSRRVLMSREELVKEEKTCEEQVYYKNENFIKMEFQNFEDVMLTHKEDDIIKIKEYPLDELETTTEKNETVKIEDQEFDVIDEEIDIKTHELGVNRFQGGAILPGLSKPHIFTDTNVLGVKMYQCDTCSYQTKKKSDLILHLLIHKSPSEVPIYKCESCSYQSKNKYYLQRHLLVHRDPSEIKMLKCEHCLYQTNRSNNLRKHLLVHKDPSGMTMYKCKLCSFETKRKTTLNVHNITHKNASEVTTYTCESCSYQTRSSGNFKKHLLVHKDPSEVTMYKCESCPFQTKRKVTLIMHNITHKNPAEIIRYQCDECSFQSKYKSSIRHHMLTHKDPSDCTFYQCESCSHKTKYKSSFLKHKLTHKDA